MKFKYFSKSYNRIVFIFFCLGLFLGCFCCFWVGTENILRAKAELSESADRYDSSMQSTSGQGNAYTGGGYRSSADGLAEYLEEDVVERLTKRAKEKEEMSLIAAKVVWCWYFSYVMLFAAFVIVVMSGVFDCYCYFIDVHFRFLGMKSLRRARFIPQWIRLPVRLLTNRW